MTVDVRYPDLTAGVWRSLIADTTWPWSSRDQLVYGTYEPDYHQVGITSAPEALDEYNSSSANTVTIADGAEIADRIIYGDVTFAGAAELHNCLLVGGANTLTSQGGGVLKCTNSRSGIARLTDCTIKPRQETNGRDCVVGRQFELYRCHISGGIDGVGIFYAGNCQVKVYGCLIEDLTYVYPDSLVGSHTDGTHNDCIQIQGGTGIHILGNSLRGTAHALAGTGTNPVQPWLLTDGPWCNGSGVIVQNNVGAGGALDSTVIIEHNWIRACRSHLQVKSTGKNWRYEHNHHYTDVAFKSGEWNRWYIGVDSRSSSSPVTGLISGGSISNSTNVWADGPNIGAPLSSPQANGIQSGA